MQPTTQQSVKQSHYDQREAVLTQVITSLPALLRKCDEVSAATIVAGLLKAHMARRGSEVDEVDDLDVGINRARAEAAEIDVGDNY